jgi:hypothetical protein
MMNVSRRGIVVAVAALLWAGLGVVAGAPAGAATVARFCDHDLGTGQETCFRTEPELLAHESAAALEPLVTVFNDIGWKGANGYYNFVNAYGRNVCDAEPAINEASAGDFGAVRYNNGITLNDTVSSFYIRPGSHCRVTMYRDIRFEGGFPIRASDDNLYHGCDDLRDCWVENWSDKASSIAVT